MNTTPKKILPTKSSLNLLMRTQLALKTAFHGQYIERLNRRVEVNYPAHTNVRYGLYLDGKLYSNCDDEEVAVNFLYNI